MRLQALATQINPPGNREKEWSMKEKTWLLEIKCGNAFFDKVQGILALRVNFGWEEKESVNGEALFAIHYADREFLRKLADEIMSFVPEAEASLSEAPEVNWQEAWKDFFTPVECGSRFVVLPPWLAHMEHMTRTAIVIEPRSAFGTGHHASTRLCLAALSSLADAGRLVKSGWFLDLGCGSGVLGIAACKLGMDGTGLDIDPVAIANARENRELNETSRLELLAGGIEKVKGEKFDLIMANILSRPLIEMAPAVMGAIKKGGALILGGILDTQADAVADAYSSLGTPQIIAEDEWRALVWS